MSYLELQQPACPSCFLPGFLAHAHVPPDSCRHCSGLPDQLRISQRLLENPELLSVLPVAASLYVAASQHLVEPPLQTHSLLGAKYELGVAASAIVKGCHLHKLIALCERYCRLCPDSLAVI